MNNRLLGFVYAYYDNQDMFKRHAYEWSLYPDWVKQDLSIFVTDDCSTKRPLQNALQFPGGIDGHAWRITKKKPWNWLACRNLGAHKSNNKWILLTDMDHLVSVGSAEKLMDVLRGANLDEAFVYLLTRIDAPLDTPYKPHNDSYLMTRKLFWQIGGYDEELSGHYGTSGRYRNRAFEIAKGNKRLDIPLTRYPKEVIADANTNEFVRKGPGRDRNAISRIEAKKRKQGRSQEIRTLSFHYEELILYGANCK